MSTSLTNTSNYMSDSASTIVGTIFRRFSDAIVTETWQYQLRSSKGRQINRPERLSTLLCTLAKKTCTMSANSRTTTTYRTVPGNAHFDLQPMRNLDVRGL